MTAAELGLVRSGCCFGGSDRREGEEGKLFGVHRIRHMASRMKEYKEQWAGYSEHQQTPECVRVIVDSDHAGELSRRRVTTGAFAMLGNHCLRLKSEYYAIVKAAAQGLHTAAICADLVLELGLHCNRWKESRICCKGICTACETWQAAACPHEAAVIQEQVE
eukprot:2870088-Amphidinium_carterae.1